MKFAKLFDCSPVFETHRLTLRRLKIEDASDYFTFASNPLVTTFTWWDYHKSIEDSLKYINYVIEKYESKGAYHWGIVYKDTNKLIGRTGFVSIDEFHKKTEIGFALSNDFWKMGIITEATKPIIRYGFEELELNRIEGRCNFENFGSEKVMNKLGMTFEGTLREQLNIKGKYTDQKMFSILRREYVSSFEEGSSIS
ncbi:GNAT family N-acetyltransferase [Paenibacillus sp. OK003]|uniref:GNAT family N-acetyltransferase n=1 Tax=Paenibacillus sp. OK003 TaxID=1884380 RepID=UPI0008AD6D9C|nr:GNAT family N-acetyltransferase [Paenibacillus sp. OK003]SEK24739.1 ribosomal-protein-alanine N-acetyltransferase [Paenibacillus sp. OK003]